MALNLALMGRNNLREKVKGVKGAKSLGEKGRIEGGERQRNGAAGCAPGRREGGRPALGDIRRSEERGEISDRSSHF